MGLVLRPDRLNLCGGNPYLVLAHGTVSLWKGWYVPRVSPDGVREVSCTRKLNVSIRLRGWGDAGGPFLLLRVWQCQSGMLVAGVTVWFNVGRRIKWACRI